MTHRTTKIATCCYCGTRAALVLNGSERHELACSGCGAPLHNLKAVPIARDDTGHGRGAYVKPKKKSAPLKARKKKKKKGGFAWALGEAFDAIEDIFD